MAGIFPRYTTISRLCACGADFGFDPYISDVPDVQCDLNTTNDLTVQFTAMLNPDERVIIAKRPLKKCESWIEDIYIFQVFKDAWKFHNDNSLRGFRDKQAELKLYARYYTVENCAEESCRDCNSCIRPSFSLSRSAIIRLTWRMLVLFINRLHAISGRGGNYATQPRHAGIN